MRYLRERLVRIPTLLLVAYVGIADVALFAGVIPFELYCRSAIVTHRNDTRLLLMLLVANACLLVFFLGAFVVSSLLFGRGVSLLGRRVIQPVRRPAPALARSIRSAR